MFQFYVSLLSHFQKKLFTISLVNKSRSCILHFFSSLLLLLPFFSFTFQCTSLSFSYFSEEWRTISLLNKGLPSIVPLSVRLLCTPYCPQCSSPIFPFSCNSQKTTHAFTAKQKSLLVLSTFLSDFSVLGLA